MAKLWGGRFSKDTDVLMEDFHSSIRFDKRLYDQDISGSIAHAMMLGNIGVITKEEARILVEGLKQIRKDIEDGTAFFNDSDEDIHMNIERLLTEKVGDVGKKIHTGRSRNDQVALDLKMYLTVKVKESRELLINFISVLYEKASSNQDVIMPGYTHLQRAQPITFAHHLIAYIEMFRRDVTRLNHWLELHNTSPLGSGALAGTTYPLNRKYTAQILGFEAPCNNSLDGVSDRDYVLDYHYAASLSMIHLSRLCEEIILWSSQEFNFVTLDDSYSTGSSIMPQKKNPDVAELVRGKSGRVVGNLVALLMTMKGLPLAYNKDMQEDKEGLFDTVDTWHKCLTIMSPLISTMKLNTGQMFEAASGGFTNATDLADYLVLKTIPFREAHRIVGELVTYCICNNKSLLSLTLEEFKAASQLIEEDVYNAIAIETCVNRRNTDGGTGKDAVQRSLRKIEGWIISMKKDEL